MVVLIQWLSCNRIHGMYIYLYMTWFNLYGSNVVKYIPHLAISDHEIKAQLVGGFNPFEKY